MVLHANLLVVLVKTFLSLGLTFIFSKKAIIWTLPDHITLKKINTYTLPLSIGYGVPP